MDKAIEAASSDKNMSDETAAKVEALVKDQEVEKDIIKNTEKEDEAQKEAVEEEI